MKKYQKFKFKNDGITMVVASVIALIIDVSYKFYTNFENNNVRLTKKQELTQLEARMLTILRKDLRSSIKIDKTIKDRYILEIVNDGSKNFTTNKTIEWKYDKENFIVTRISDNKKIFDFSKLLPDNKKFSFKIH